MNATHDLKISTAYFDPVMSNAKPFEVRNNRDRDFRVGDVLRLREWEMSNGYTSRECLRDVTYVLTDAPFCPPGFAILGLAAAPEAPAAAEWVTDDEVERATEAEETLLAHGWEWNGPV